MGILVLGSIRMCIMGVLVHFFFNAKIRVPKIPRMRCAKWGFWSYTGGEIRPVILLLNGNHLETFVETDGHLNNMKTTATLRRPKK